jgi:hypothetical protein
MQTMATTNLTDVFTTLFTAPAGAATRAEREYRRIWLEWLRELAAITDAAPGPMSSEQLARHLELAPVLSFESLIEVGLTMRVASVSETRAGLAAGLRLSVIETSGSLGFMSRSTQESVLQAKAQYTLSNTSRMTLSDYLGTMSITLASPDDVKTAIGALESIGAAPLAQAA